MQAREHLRQSEEEEGAEVVSKLQQQVRDLEQSLTINKEILNSVLSGGDPTENIVQQVKDLRKSNT
jgi:hypothetical protein